MGLAKGHVIKGVGKMNLPLFEYRDLGMSDFGRSGKALKAGNPCLIIQQEPQIVSWSKMDNPKSFSVRPNKQRQVLDMLIQNGSTTAFDIQKATNSTDARKIISRLRKEGYIGRTGVYPLRIRCCLE